MDSRELWTSLERIFEMYSRKRGASKETARLQRRCVCQVREMSSAERRISLGRYVQIWMLSEEALAQDKGWPEVLAFLGWINGGME